MLVTQDNLGEVLLELQCQRTLSLDTETTGLSETDRPFAFIIANRTTEYYFDARVIPLSVPWLHLLVCDTDRTWLFQNAKFDMRMMGYLGYEFKGNILDMTIMGRLIRNDHTNYSLEAQGIRIGMKKGADKIKEYINAHELYELRNDFFGVTNKQPRYDYVPIELMEEYACMDARITYDLYTNYSKQMDDKSFAVLCNEAQLTKVCYQMERTGLLLNKDYTIQARYHELEIVDARKAAYERHTGKPYVNSAKSIQSWMGDTILPLTPKGNPTLTDEVIENYLADEKIEDNIKIGLKLVQEIRHYEKRVNTYYDGYLNSMDSAGIVHPTMWQGGTKTGRFSYSNPNLQNIPKEEESTEPFVVRGCFQPRPGTVYVSFDYSQMEYRMMAAYAKEEEIIKRVMSGEDFHKVTADMFGVTRKLAKTLNFAILYGAGDAKLAGMLDIPLREARNLKLKYFMALPKVDILVDNIVRTGKSRGYVTNWLGRRLHAVPTHCYALPNHLIQGGGADVVKVAMVRIASEVPHIPMVLQIHDQLVFEVKPEDYVDLPVIKRIMEEAFPPMNGMELTVDVEWSAKSLATRDMTKGYPNEYN